MKVSVIIPAHNEEASLPETLRAVLAQDYPDFEVIVVDNASTDGTARVVGDFPEVKLVSESRKGLLWAREAGRVASSGDIIANIDADCLPDRGWIDHAVSLFTSDNIVAVSGPYDYHDGGRVFRTVSLWTQKYVYYFMSKFLQLPFISGRAVIIGGNNFIRAKVLEDAGGYNTSLTFYGEDTDTARRISMQGKVVFSPSVVMRTSARRFESEGTLKLVAKYWYYFFKHILMKK